MSARATATILILCLLLPVSAAARIWLVNPDGTGDAPTIQAAVDSLSSGDEIILADGVYTGAGNRDVYNSEKLFAIKSLSGDPAACVIDCQGSEGEPHRAFSYSGGG